MAMQKVEELGPVEFGDVIRIGRGARWNDEPVDLNVFLRAGRGAHGARR